MRSVAVIAYDQISLTELAVAYHVFAHPYAGSNRATASSSALASPNHCAPGLG